MCEGVTEKRDLAVMNRGAMTTATGRVAVTHGGHEDRASMAAEKPAQRIAPVITVATAVSTMAPRPEPSRMRHKLQDGGSELMKGHGGQSASGTLPAACFPNCMKEDDDHDPCRGKEGEASTMATAQAAMESSGPPLHTPRWRRRLSERQGKEPWGALEKTDNQATHEETAGGDPPVKSTTLLRSVSSATTMDMEEWVDTVLSPRDKPGIIVDYDEGVPDRSRAALLVQSVSQTERQPPTEQVHGQPLKQVMPPHAIECAPDACRPLDAADPARLLLSKMRLHDARSTQPSMEDSTITTRSKWSSASCEEPPATVKNEPDAGVARCSEVAKLCLCEVGLHTSRTSCWMVAKGAVYDVTGVIATHPGGSRSILRKAGGMDCHEDMQFHSKAARRKLEKCFIGKLQPCGDGEDAQGNGACTIM